MLFRVILLLVVHFALCQTKKVFHYERNIEVIEHADIQSLFDLIDEISQHTSSLAELKKDAHVKVSSKTERFHHTDPTYVDTIESLNELSTKKQGPKDKHRHKDTQMKSPNLPLKNLYRNTLTDLHFSKQKLVSLGFKQSERKKRNLPVVVNAGIFSHVLGIASVADVNELKEKIDEAILEIRQGSDRNNIRTIEILKEFRLIQKCQEYSMNISMDHDLDLFLALKTHMLNTRINFMIINLQVIMLSESTHHDFFLYTDKLNYAIDKTLDNDTYALFRQSNISDIRKFGNMILTTFDKYELTQKISIPILKTGDDCHYDKLDPDTNMIRAYCVSKQKWISVCKGTCVEYENDLYCAIRPCHFKTVENPCHSLNSNTFVFFQENNCTLSNGRARLQPTTTAPYHGWGKHTTTSGASGSLRDSEISASSINFNSTTKVTSSREDNWPGKQHTDTESQGKGMSIFLSQLDSLHCNDIEIGVSLSPQTVELENSIVKNNRELLNINFDDMVIDHSIQKLLEDSKKQIHKLSGIDSDNLNKTWLQRYNLDKFVIFQPDISHLATAVCFIAIISCLVYLKCQKRRRKTHNVHPSVENTASEYDRDRTNTRTRTNFDILRKGREKITKPFVRAKASLIRGLRKSKKMSPKFRDQDHASSPPPTMQTAYYPPLQNDGQDRHFHNNLNVPAQVHAIPPECMGGPECSYVSDKLARSFDRLNYPVRTEPRSECMNERPLQQSRKEHKVDMTQNEKQNLAEEDDIEKLCNIPQKTSMTYDYDDNVKDNDTERNNPRKNSDVEYYGDKYDYDKNERQAYHRQDEESQSDSD